MGSSPKVAPIQATQYSAAPSVIQGQSQAASDPRVQSILSQFGKGGLNLSDALSQLKGGPSGPSVNGLSLYDLNRYAPQDQGNAVGLLNALYQAHNAVNNTDEGSDKRQLAENKVTELENQLRSMPTASDLSGARQQASANQLFLSPETGTLAATQQVLDNPFYQNFFGADAHGGILKQATDQYSKLNDYYNQGTQQYQGMLGQYNQDRGYLPGAYNNINLANQQYQQSRDALLGKGPLYGMTEGDLTALGQASGNIERQFAGASQDFAQKMASRGLSAGGGVPTSLFSNMYGNQQEQLAQLQQQIANQRIATGMQLAQAAVQADLGNIGQANTTLGNTIGLLNSDVNAMGTQNQYLGNINQGIGSQGALMTGLGQLGQNAIQDQFGNNLAGINTGYNMAMGANNINMADWAGKQNASDNAISSYNQAVGQQANGLLGLGGAILGGAANVASAGLLGAKPTVAPQPQSIPSTYQG